MDRGRKDLDRFRAAVWVSVTCCVMLSSFCSCALKPQATGADNELGILVDSTLRASVESELLSTFCPIVVTPQPERRFIPIFADLEGLDRIQTQRFLLLVGTLHGVGEVSKLITRMLSPEVAQGVEEGEYYVFKKRDEWARGQTLVILVTRDAQMLRQRLATEAGELFKLFDEKRDELIKEKLYRSYEQTDLARAIRERYGFNLRIPHDYVLVREAPEEGWLRLKRAAPTRAITLWRSFLLADDPVDSTWMLTTWSDLASRFADPLRLNLDYLLIQETKVAGFPGMEMRGLWESQGPLGGGPFLCRAFYYPADKRVYLLEGEVYNPGDVKEPYLKQLEVILDTFGPEEKTSSN